MSFLRAIQLSIDRAEVEQGEYLMEYMNSIRPGLEYQLNYLVEDVHSATHIGSGGVKVLSTPSLIGFMERTAHQLLAKNLVDGWSSVGVRVDIAHLAPTPIDSTIKVRCEILQVDGNQVTLLVEAWDDVEKIGEGKHLRVVIDQERFLKRVAKKASSLSQG
ncbi:MAG TPA: thioesterase family protein [Anaerolineales bacterium]|nr:thioesterase family protein [Anaerolineales bacterium]